MTKQLIISLCAAGAISLMAGCENMGGPSRSSGYQRVQPDVASAARVQSDQLNQLSATVVSLTNTNNEVIKVVNDLNQKIATLEQRNAALEKSLAAMQQQLANQRQETQASISKMIEQVSKEVSKASVSAPSSGGGPVGTGEFFEHKVESGQTLGAIAKAYNVSVQDIMSANRMKDTNLRIGQTIYVPKKK
ncbi:MAG TPA: hypothetical protein DET40_14370 [Lentisphaeria bacterium]|nr:MAG: hypothetical protein A2X45_05545 [Lentisphaerae bacterium GWF2_50_93]HCE44723.1 hypothetical protein [Lentisphaeria bacterium]